MTKFESNWVVPKYDTYGEYYFEVEAAQGFLEQLNGDRAVPAGLEHDPHFFPIGKIVNVSMEELEDRFVFRSVIDDTHHVRRFRSRRTGQPMVEVTFSDDQRPFYRLPPSGDIGPLEARADPINFEAVRSFEEFAMEAADPTDLADHVGLMSQRSLTPEPVIQFFLNYPELAAVLGWAIWRGQKFLTYTVDETLRKVGDELSKIASCRIRNIIRKFDNHRAPDRRDATSHIVILGDLEIHLLTRNSDIENQTNISLASLRKQMEIYADELDSAESVTFARTYQAGDWELHYIETASGTVIASSQCYEQTVEAYDALRRTMPICLCLEHNETGEERHYQTSATFTETDVEGDFQMAIRPIPDDIAEWHITQVVLDIERLSHHPRG